MSAHAWFKSGASIQLAIDLAPPTPSILNCHCCKLIMIVGNNIITGSWLRFELYSSLA